MSAASQTCDLQKLQVAPLTVPSFLLRCSSRAEITCASGDADDKQRAFYDRLSEFCTYIDRNSEQIPNYGERHRCGEPISTATAEATVNQVISRRMVKKQQMRWSPRGAHLLLQIRTRVLNDDLVGNFAAGTPDSPAQLSEWTPLPDLPRFLRTS